MRSRSASRPSFRPRVEALESRALLSVCLVDRLTDKGEGEKLVGDLRYCIEQAQDKDSIQFAVKGTINLTRVLPELTRSISIEGPGADVLTTQRNSGGDYRIFAVVKGVTVSLSGFTLANGLVPGGVGGGILNAGTLTITECTLSSNTARFGGGVYNTGLLMIGDTTLSGNRAVVQLGSAASGGGIHNAALGTVILTNSTLSGNQAIVQSGSGGSAHGGGIINSTASTLTVINSTLTRNGTVANPANGSRGGGIAVVGGTVTLHNTILAGNAARSGPNLNGTLSSSGWNLIGNPAGGSGYDETDLLNVDPLLGPLADNGGPTWTHALMEGSPAIDAGDPTDAPEWDQRGEGFSRIAGKNIDIGAYEEQGRGGSPSPGRPPRFDVGVLLADHALQPVRDVDSVQTVHGSPLAAPSGEGSADRPAAPVEAPRVLPERGTSRTEPARFFEDPIQDAPSFVMSTIR